MTTVDERAYAELRYGRPVHGVSRSITVALDDGRTVDIDDTWWRKNPDVWTGWQVHLIDADSLIARTWPRTKKRGEVVAAVREVTR